MVVQIRIAPQVSVESPEVPSNATAVAHINSSAGTVSRIELIDQGHRYKVVPRVFVMPPMPEVKAVLQKQ